MSEAKGNPTLTRVLRITLYGVFIAGGIVALDHGHNCSGGWLIAAAVLCVLNNGF